MWSIQTRCYEGQKSGMENGASSALFHPISRFLSWKSIIASAQCSNKMFSRKILPRPSIFLPAMHRPNPPGILSMSTQETSKASRVDRENHSRNEAMFHNEKLVSDRKSV